MPDALSSTSVGDVDPAHPAIGRSRQPEKNLVVAEREPVISRQLRAQSPRRRGMRPHERRERSPRRLLDQYLTAHLFFLYSCLCTQ